MREVRAAGREAVDLICALLRRARLTDPTAGLWEAADLQWWWRRPRASDAVPQLFWVDDDGPAAGVHLHSWTGATWQVDPIVVPGLDVVAPHELWARAWDLCRTYAVGSLEVAVRDDDPVLRALVEASGLEAGDSYTQTWMDVADRPDVLPLPEGFRLVDRTERIDTPHPMRGRNGEAVAERLAACSLYDPWLDLSVETVDGHVAAYSLYWHDPVTGVGLVEPVRVEDEFHRRGLARAMISVGLDRLATRGARRLKVGFASEAAGALYQGLGFRPVATDTTFGTQLPG